MRYIQKLDTPNFFTEDTQLLTDWKNYKKKKKLKEYILKNEQNYLCCYCESKVTILGDKEKDGSHLEHIKPKKFYADLTFYYNNLLVSCQGTCHNSENDKTRYSCGHKKDDEYIDNKFLNPTIVEDIRDYFKYETIENEKVKIVPTAKDSNKAEYMINLLHLNDDTLLYARGKALKDFEEFWLEIEVDDIRSMLTEDLEFISFLRYEYSF
ncbi:conserved hypothetical protein [hydrothermal vent metagenome]|uniref:TIGR02646 family protein n=1 Tax=hydrothermal vent metagenome TaxID=652676 RepID=A0A1W1CK63_9ZZZZ